MSLHIAIIAASLETNALGRAATLFDILPERVNRLGIWGPPARKIWQRYDERYTISPLNRAAMFRLNQSVRALAARGETPLIWISKGYPSASSLVRKLPTNVTIVADFDDDDISLAREFAAQSWTNRMRLNPLRAGSPERLTRSQRAIKARADLTTTSSNYLAEQLNVVGKTLRVPHGRSSAHHSITEISDFRNLGFLGTMRAHKGLDKIVTALRGDARLSLTTFAQRGLDVPTDLSHRWRTIPPDSALERAYETINVSLLPLDVNSPGALAQLPAKAIDAAASATPIASSSTPVIEEYFGDAILEIHDWSRLGLRLEEAFHNGELQRLAAASRGVWEREFDLEVLRQRIVQEFNQFSLRFSNGE